MEKLISATMADLHSVTLHLMQRYVVYDQYNLDPQECIPTDVLL